MLCDGDRLIVVAGYHHSGTSMLQAQLARRLGLPVPTTTDERWPTDHHEEACSPEWSVFRTRLSGLRDVHRFARLRNRFPAARLVFCARDAPNQIWSLMRRACAESPRLATYLAKQRCQVLEKEARWRRPGARDWTVDLADFAVDSRTILQQVVPGHLASPDAPSLFIESAAVRVPSFGQTGCDGGRCGSPLTRTSGTASRARAARWCRSCGRSATARASARCRP